MGSIIIYTNGHRSSCHDFSQVSGLCHEPDILSASSVSMGISHSSKMHLFVSELPGQITQVYQSKISMQRTIV